jgi:hypothetical protein
MKNFFFYLILFSSLISTGQTQQNINKNAGTTSNVIATIDSIRFNSSSTTMEVVLQNGTVESHSIADIINVNFISVNQSQHSCGANNVHNPAKTYGTMTDQQGNVYKTIVIGAQEWMAENLKTTIYRNGNVIDNYKKHEKICSSYKALANSKFLDVNSDYYGVHDHPYKDIDGIIYNSYLKYDEDEDEDTYIGPNSCDKNSINEIPLVINHYYTKSQEEYMKRCKLWVNGGINNHGYRENCEENFKEKDVKDITGYKYIKHTNWYKYV